MIARSSGIAVLLFVLTGCNEYMDGYDCLNPDKGHRDAQNNPDPCHHNDVGAAKCDVGDFVHWAIQWEDPTLLWFGPADQVPECPRGPMTIAYEAQTDLVALSACEACTCEPPTGSCALSSTLTASTTACSMPGGASTSFNAPSPWDGSCDSTTQTPSGASQSLTIEPMTMIENGCALGPPVAAKVVSLHWDTFARGCDIDLPDGPADRSKCLPPDIIPSGFALCIFHEGERDCPTDPGNVFTEKHVFYNGVQDDRQCSACSCGAPTGSVCTAQLAVYEGASCSGSPLMSNPISSAKLTCLDITIPGQALGSKSAGAVTYLPGTCPPEGGDGSGSAIPIKPDTFCCRPNTL
jgi:hypothetical protein